MTWDRASAPSRRRSQGSQRSGDLPPGPAQDLPPGQTRHSSPSSSNSAQCEDRQDQDSVFCLPREILHKHHRTKQNSAELLPSPTPYPLGLPLVQAPQEHLHGRPGCSEGSLRTSDALASFLASIKSECPQQSWRGPKVLCISPSMQGAS